MTFSPKDAWRLEGREGHQTVKLENIPAEKARPQRWHLLYFALAAFDVLTVCGSFWLSHRLAAIYSDTVHTNQKWAERGASYDTIAKLAGAVPSGCKRTAFDWMFFQSVKYAATLSVSAPPKKRFFEPISYVQLVSAA